MQPAGGYCFSDLSYRSALIPGNVKFKTYQASTALAKEGRGGDNTLGFVLHPIPPLKAVPNQQRGPSTQSILLALLNTLFSFDQRVSAEEAGCNDA